VQLRREVEASEGQTPRMEQSIQGPSMGTLTLSSCRQVFEVLNHGEYSQYYKSFRYSCSSVTAINMNNFNVQCRCLSRIASNLNPRQVGENAIH